MDAVYILSPYWFKPAHVYQPANQRISGMPSEKELLDRYTAKAGFDSRKDKWEVAQIFHLIRVSTPSPIYPIHSFHKIGMKECEELMEVNREAPSAMASKHALLLGRPVVSSHINTLMRFGIILMARWTRCMSLRLRREMGVNYRMLTRSTIKCSYCLIVRLAKIVLRSSRMGADVLCFDSKRGSELG